VNLFVDTSVWSLAFRRDTKSPHREVELLSRGLEGGMPVFSTGLVLQELLQGFRGPKAKERIIDRFAALPLLVPDRTDHIDAAGLRNACRQRGLQIGTIDALLAQLCLRHELTVLTTDRDFLRIAEVCPLAIWRAN
jgi:predicted nucleic acid-binding protein